MMENQDFEASVITVGQAAKLFDRSERWIQNVVSEGFIAKPKKGVYVLKDVLAGGLSYLEVQTLANCGADFAKQYVLNKNVLIADLQARIAQLEAKLARS